MQRESMDFDIVIVGAGPAGLSTAIRLMQQAKSASYALTVCVVEKGSEVGAHILSGAIFETTALDELIPDWQQQNAPISTCVKYDAFYYLPKSNKGVKVPEALVPNTLDNTGNYIVSMGKVCRWLAQQAEALGVEIFPGFTAQSVLYDNNKVIGIITGDMGRDSKNQEKDSFMPGMELRAKYTVFAEGARGHLGKELIEKYELNKNTTDQHYGLGFKEVWDIPAELHQPGLVIHTAGWPLNDKTSGGGFLYHGENQQVYVGMIVDLNYKNPHLSPFDEFQRYKHHPVISRHLRKGKRVSYGARALTKGGLNALPKQTMPGAFLIGCDAGTVNFAKIKGNHTAMKSGMLAADTLIDALLNSDKGGSDLTAYEQKFNTSWLYNELNSSKNFGRSIQKFGTFLGGAFNTINHNFFTGKLSLKPNDDSGDDSQLSLASDSQIIIYEKPDNILSFDKLSSVYLSNTSHEEDQPCHLKLADTTIPITVNLTSYNEPALRYCPAGVYEIEVINEEKVFVINAQNCIHCKTCDIKDPSKNITWTPPEGGSGPNYSNM